MIFRAYISGSLICCGYLVDAKDANLELIIKKYLLFIIVCVVFVISPFT